MVRIVLGLAAAFLVAATPTPLGSLDELLRDHGFATCRAFADIQPEDARTLLYQAYAVGYSDGLSSAQGFLVVREGTARPDLARALGDVRRDIQQTHSVDGTDLSVLDAGSALEAWCGQGNRAGEPLFVGWNEVIRNTRR